MNSHFVLLEKRALKNKSATNRGKVERCRARSTAVRYPRTRLERNRDDDDDESGVGKDAAGRNLLAMIAWTIGAPGAAAVYFPSIFPLIARESVLLELFINRFRFRSRARARAHVSVDGNANNSPPIPAAPFSLSRVLSRRNEGRNTPRERVISRISHTSGMLIRIPLTCQQNFFAVESSISAARGVVVGPRRYQAGRV